MPRRQPFIPLMPIRGPENKNINFPRFISIILSLFQRHRAGFRTFSFFSFDRVRSTTSRPHLLLFFLAEIKFHLRPGVPADASVGMDGIVCKFEWTVDGGTGEGIGFPTTLFSTRYITLSSEAILI